MPELQGHYQQEELYQKLESIVQTNPTGRVMLRSEQRLATVFIANQKVVDAVLGTKKGLEAFESLLSWREGEFRFSPGMVSQTPSLDLGLEALNAKPAQAPVQTPVMVQTPVSAALSALQATNPTGVWETPSAAGMTGNLRNVDIVNLLRVLCNVGQSGLLRLRPKDEARVYIANGSITHAAFQNLRGMQALSEIATWTTDTFRFENGLTNQEINVSLPLSQILGKMGEVIAAKASSPNMDSSVMYFYSLPVPQNTHLNPLALEIIKSADGTSFEELVQTTNSSNDAVAGEIKNLLDQNLIRTEFSPSTPKALRSIKPQHAEAKRGLFAAKPKLTLEQLNRLELSVYDQIDGGRTLWDIRVNLGISRQEVWNAFQRLLEGGLAIGKPA